MADSKQVFDPGSLKDWQPEPLRPRQKPSSAARAYKQRVKRREMKRRGKR
jgi:hypothetical protein